MKDRVAALMPSLLDELIALAKIPSISVDPAYKSSMVEMADATVDLFKRSGATNARLLEIPGDNPAVYAEVEGPKGAPTVLLYAHYDVQPAPDSQGWDSDPWTPTRKDDGRIYGRGISDDKAGIVIHAGLLQLFEGQPPVNLRVIIEGSEESISYLDVFLEANPELARCDVALVADMGNPRPGHPAVTTALRGVVQFPLTVRTLDHPVHSGVFGGAAPDAVIALSRLIATFHDDKGDIAVAGLHSFEWDGDLDEDEFRKNADILDGVDTIGTGPLASRLWSRPSITVTGIDIPTVAGASTVLLHETRAMISMRIAPDADPQTEFDVLREHIEHNVPWGARIEFGEIKLDLPFKSSAYGLALDALRDAYGVEAEAIGSGGAVPLVNTLQSISPDAPMILWGTHDTAKSRIHGSNESVDPTELESILLAQALLLQRLYS